MAQPLFAERRTRSQLALPDDLLLSLPQQSPLKNARAARTVYPDTPRTDSLEPHEQPEQHLLHSMHPPADEPRQKRSMSPPAEGTPSRHSEPPPDRQVKRAKKAFDSAPRKRVGASNRRTHTRFASDPNAGRARRSIRKRSTPPAEPVPLADARGSMESEPRPVNGRAQSVPLFPASYSFPFIDFKNLPPSPRRARSRSPEKEEQKLGIIFEPTKLDVAVDENEEKMDVEEDAGQPISIAIQTIETHSTITTDSNASPAISPQRNSLANQYAPSTPALLRPDLLIALSPLTPLSESPLPDRGNTGHRRRGPAAQSNNSGEYVEPRLAKTSQIDLASGDLQNHVFSSPLAQSVPRSEDPALHVPLGTQRNGLTVPGRKSSKSSNSDAFAIMMRASQGKTNPPIRSTLDKGKQKDVGRASTSLAEDYPKRSMSGATVKNGGSYSKLKSRMRPREKPRVEPILKLSVPPEPEPGTDGRENSQQLGGDHESAMGHETLDSMPSVEKSSLPIEPPSLTETPEQRESESGITDGLQCDTHPTITDIQKDLPLDLPGEQIHSPPQDASSIETLPRAELEHFSPLTSQDISEKAFTESVRNVEPQDEVHLPTESTEIEYDQLAEGDSMDASKASQIPDPVVPVPKASSRRGARSGQKKLTSIPVGRMTRSAASKLKTTEPSVARSALRSNIAVTPRVTCRRSASMASPSGKSAGDAQWKAGSSKTVLMADTVPPLGAAGSSLPIKSSNYARPTTSSNAKVTKTPIKSSRASTLRASRPSSTAGSRASSPFSRFLPKVPSDATAPSSLSTLSTALEKLRMPPPSRPSTSTGFYTTSDDSGIPTAVTHVASNTGAAGLGNGLPSTNTKLRRRSSSFTLPTNTHSAGAAKPQSALQQPISNFFASKQSTASTGPDELFKPSNKHPPKPRIFGVGSRGVFGIGMRSRAPKVSRKTSLPMVVGSPVKGGEPMDNDTSKGGVYDDDDDNSLEIVMGTTSDTLGLGEDEYLVPIAGGSPKETGKKKEKDDNSQQGMLSRRASLASLAASLSALPPKGSMGPPPIPHGRITRSISGSHVSTSHTKSPEADDAGISDTAFKTKDSSSIGSPLKFLKNCVVFVDVRTDDGDDAGSLFVEMLKSAGAKLLTRVGQTCTHIIFKNGLLSTMSKYRILRDPKPHVVGIAWVVECVEQRKQVDESKFLVDLSDIQVAVVNKRRKSLLPKLVADELDGTITRESDNGTEEDGDRSMDGSNSSLILDDLPPLERARRRKSTLFGSRP